ncbi:hypothetical protein SAMN04487772_11443 [[Clostridium] polysaccharolyticum]|jgi:hypothetical protein|uniref:Secreted protein n=1 Tax=[Clostridium] polysaccharolyticum TaxID=29364 RepID=A0A1I0DF31_9FIRM|nr:hypothetical protein SAMN04487772_11443 [[Clostridium] polysaccharolyticum]
MKLTKICKVLTFLLLSVTLIGTNSNICYASTRKPTKNTNCIDLSQDKASLSFQVNKLKYGGLYTNSTFTGVKTIKIY